MDSLNYDKFTQQALKDVVRQALAVAAEEGLSNNHHFYITFRTDREDVLMPDYLRAQHPQDITIVIQYHYSDLLVFKQRFEITLAFNAASERLVVPFDAITGFMDPAVKFGLEFDPVPYAAGEPVAIEKEQAITGGVAIRESVKRSDSCEVVSLEAFRKKQQEKK